MTTNEIKIAGFRLFESTAVAMMNVQNGCAADQSIVNANMPRLQKMVAWMNENGLAQDFKLFAFSPKFNTSRLHFQTSKLYNLLNA